jgi:hypothetical protein
MLRKRWLLIAFASISVASPVLACNGEACQDISIKTDGKGCVLVQNRGMRAVKVKLGFVSFTVRGGETFYPKDTGGTCLTGYVGSGSATYAN